MKRFVLSPSPLCFFSALFLWTWAGLCWAIEMEWMQGLSIAHHLFRQQDAWALALGGLLLLVAAPFAGREQPASWQWIYNGWLVGGLLLLFSILAWSGYYFLFSGYALSRDEQVAQFGAAVLRHGALGWPIPPEWVPYRRAIMPEFYSPFGADHMWTSAYLPLNSAFQALWAMAGDSALAGPAFLLIGMLSLWRVAARLFPDRPDAQAVTLLMALSSAQLLTMAMTPYAMTGHFALNMLWLALLLRGGMAGHAAAGIVVLVLSGLHQYHYPFPFLLPFLLWFALGRRWGAFLFHTAILAVAVVIWAKLWPQLLIDLHGPAADVRPSLGVADKMDSLVDRVLAKWHPLLHLSRFLAWNNFLLVPLAVIGLWRMDWRAALRGRSVALPLGMGAFGMAALAMDQGYGWGYRYLHAFIGSFALLAGFGWAALRRPEGSRRLPLVALSVLIACVTGGFLMKRAHDYVAPYAAAHRLILDSGADVVLVDPRGGRYVTDLVRGRDDEPIGRPVVMNIGLLNSARIDRLCAAYDVALFDRSAFEPLGMGLIEWNNRHIANLRAHMEERGCGRPIGQSGG